VSHRIAVSTAAPYDVLIAHGALSTLAALVPETAQRVAIIHAPTVTARAQAAAAALSSHTVVLICAPDGEAAKNIEFVATCWSELAHHGFTRSDVVVGMGGGATTDVAGFVAASWLRGVGLITVPTTVLGMVDAAVGGKTGIDIAEGKNLVGAFHEPLGVLCDLDALDALPARELRSGMAETIKCGFIADTSILDDVEANPVAALDPRSELLADLIARGVAVKARTVAADLHERGADGSIGREALNYGHTLGHAIEMREQFRMRHGEAISIGMVFAAELAHRTGLISADVVERHRDLLTLMDLPVGYVPGAWSTLLDTMRLDKKTRGSQLRFVVLDDLAAPRILAGPDDEALRASYQAVSS
jgi:3-dehydroquinate synthase